METVPIQIAVADSKIQVQIGNRQLDRILHSFVSWMLVDIFWQQLPIQIVVADPVADTKTKVRISNRQLVAVSKPVIIVSRVHIVIYALGTKTNQALAFFSKMIVAMFWKQLPVQIAVADSVATSQTKVRIGN